MGRPSERKSRGETKQRLLQKGQNEDGVPRPPLSPIFPIHRQEASTFPPIFYSSISGKDVREDMAKMGRFDFYSFTLYWLGLNGSRSAIPSLVHVSYPSPSW
eukprot:TRINITY_DN8441_c0_g1_i3.p1 TRINITY_DN8441_c0_g1~~TRINITY_DN8441_c0_g1_i3.p1  ORF type:complete len:102 (-),score=11.56 TRINITY_DN8441_c0_g1_i3:156-461(-)